MSSTSAVACREIFDENSQPSAEEVSDYAHQIGIDVESESHLLPLAKDGLMQALPAPWKAFFDEKLQTHYYYNEDSKQTQWEHPLDQVYRDLVRRARDEDTCASVQELLTSEENTKNVEKYEVKVDSEDEELSTDSENASDIKESSGIRRPLSGRPPLAPITRNEKKLSDIRISPLRRSIDSSLSIKPSGMPEFKRPFDRPKLFKQQSEIIDLKMHVLSNPDEDHFSSFVNAKSEKGFALTGKGSIFLKTKKPDLPSPDTEKSITLEGVTKSDPPKGILREKPDLVQKRVEVLGRPKLTASFEEDRKSVRFNLENSNVENTVSPSSNSSSSQNDGQSVISSPPVVPSQMSSPNLPLSPLVFSSPNLSLNLTPLNPPLTLAPLIARPPLPPRPQTSIENILSPRENSLKSTSGSDRESIDSDKDKGSSPRRRVVRPPAGDYIKAELFQKNFQKISDLVRPGDLETSPMQSLHVDDIVKKENRPRSPMIPLMKNKISINLMESIDSETSIDSPDKEFANLDLNDLDDFKDFEVKENIENNKNESNLDNNNAQNLKTINSIYVPQIKIPKLELLKAKNYNSDDDKVSIASKELSESKTNSKSESLDLGKEHSNQTRVLISPQLKITPSLSISSHSDLKSTRNEIQSDRSWSSHFKPIASIIKPAQIKSPDSNTNLTKVTSPRLDGLILSQNKNAIKGSDNVVVMYQFETNNSIEEKSITNKCRVIDSGRDVIERSKIDEKRRLELVLNKELDEIRSEWSAKEKIMKAELLANLREVEEILSTERKNKLAEQAERHRREMEEALQESQRSHEETLKSIHKDYEEKLRKETDLAEDKLQDSMATLRDEHARILVDERERLQFENERAMSDFSEHLGSELMRQRAKMLDENRMNVECLREEHLSRVAELRHDYRAEIERIRTQHACHLDELRGRLAGERATAARKGNGDHLHEKYRCLKEKYERLKHDVKMSLERRNKRRELSMTTGSETEKSNSHKATQSGDRSKESSDRPAIVMEADCVRATNNNPLLRCDNETSDSQPHKALTDNNNHQWENRKESILSPETSSRSGHRSRAAKKHAVAFREPTRSRETHEPLPCTPMTDCQDSSDATTADEKPKESINSHGRRRCFTRLKSASTSRLNYSPKRGEGWSSPLESLRQQLRKLDDLEDQFPDLACQPAYSLRYPFGELGGVGVISKGGTPELEFVRHRALVEREGMRRARAALRRRRDALSGRDSVEATSSASSSSEAEVAGTVGGGAVLRSLRALHADVRDIWRALDARNAASPETSSCLASSHNPSPNVMSHPRITLTPDKEILSLQAQDASVSERARGLRAWLQAP